MPLLARALGVWDGIYTRIDPPVTSSTTTAPGWLPTGSTTAHICMSMSTSGRTGRTATFRFPGTVSGGRLHFDTGRIVGAAWEIGPTNMVLNWVYKHDPTGPGP